MWRVTARSEALKTRWQRRERQDGELMLDSAELMQTFMEGSRATMDSGSVRKGG